MYIMKKQFYGITQVLGIENVKVFAQNFMSFVTFQRQF
jgi:hypothetical protein